MNSYIQYIESLGRKTLLTISLVLLAVVGAIDYLTGVELSLSAFYLLPITLAAWLLGRRAGIVIAVLGAIVWYSADVMSSVSYSHPITPYWNALVMLGIFLPTAFMLSAFKQAIDRENRLAREIQERLLPTEMPDIAGYEIAGAWQPAQSVSGDYYDVIRLDDDSFVLCVGDVVGHGIPAALLMSNLQAAVRMLTFSKLTPQEICAKLNSLIAKNTTPGTFITFFYGVLDIRKKEFIYTSAGHPQPIIIRGNGEVVSLSKGGIPIGMLPGSSYDQGTTQLGEEDIMLIYTDGVTEVSNTGKEQFGEVRVLDVLKENHRRGAHAACNGILKAVPGFSKGKYQDDIALLAISARVPNIATS